MLEAVVLPAVVLLAGTDPCTVAAGMAVAGTVAVAAAAVVVAGYYIQPVSADLARLLPDL